MREAIDAVATGEVTIASRDVELDGVPIRKGEWLGLVEGKPVAGGTSFEDVAYAVVEAPAGASRAGCSRCSSATTSRRSTACSTGSRRRTRGSSSTSSEGGQPHYHLLLSAE